MSFTFAQKEAMKTGLVVTLVSSVIYGGIAWGISKLFDVSLNEFYWILGIFVAIRCAIGFLDFVIGVIVWRIHLRKRTVDRFITIMRDGKLPKRAYCHDDIGNYLSRIIEPSEMDYKLGQITPEIQKVASDMQNAIDTVYDQHGMMADMRTLDAMRRALDIYSPEEESPQMVSHGVLHWLCSDVKETDIQLLPNATPELAKRIIAERPFETLMDLYQLLRSHGLDRMQAVIFLNGASTACDSWYKKLR